MSDTVRINALKAATRTGQLIDPELSDALTETIENWLSGSSYTAMYTGPLLTHLCDQLITVIQDTAPDGLDRNVEWKAVRGNIEWKTATLTNGEHSSVMGYTQWDDTEQIEVVFDKDFLRELDVLHGTEYSTIAAAVFVTVLLHEVAHCLTKDNGMEGGGHNDVYWGEAVYLFRHTPVHADACIAAATLFFSSDYVARLLDKTTAASVLGLIDACCI